MNKGIIIQQLNKYKGDHVDAYVNYLERLSNEKKDNKLVNPWVKNITNTEFADAFKKVSTLGIYIDGDTVTLTYRKKLVITFDYHAYKNIVLAKYPESTFDVGVVYQNDNFSFKKADGKVNYTHEINDPFSNDKQIIGVYAVLNNSKGQFLELLNTKEIGKMKSVSKMKYIWDNWYDRMALKSVIKRICNIHFKEIVSGIDSMDNESNDLSLLGLQDDVQKEINDCCKLEEITDVYNKYKESEIVDLRVLIQKCGIKSKELESVK